MHSVAFSPDGRRIVSGSVNAIYMWDAQTGPAPIEDVTQSTEDDYDGRWDACCSRVDETSGWVKNEEGKLLLWIPLRYRENIRRRLYFVIGGNDRDDNVKDIVKPEVNLKNLYAYAGTNWTKIYNPGN